ncbi:MAG TPA: hypothetical protein DCL77_14995, partial [Prolixibacteraceae bacterium]|nr:hypothetical protein [Prolixibacteraceae bacterium]
MKYSIKIRSIWAQFLFIGLLFLISACTSTYYVSNSGSDSNNGKSISSPWQTLDKVNSAPLGAGDTVLFKSGDAWYGQLVPKSGRSTSRITYGAYGKGDKPLIHASMAKMNTSDWVDQGSNIWRSKEAYPTEIGNVFLNDSLCGVRKYSEDELTAQGQFYYNPSTNFLIFYSQENPASYYSDL